MVANEQTFRVRRGITAMTAEELGAQVEGPNEPVPNQLQEDVQALVEQIKTKLASHVEENIKQAQKQKTGDGAQPAAGGPIQEGPPEYEYWDLLALSPQQFLVPGFVFRPHKIVAGGEFALLQAVLLINPNPTPGGGPPATVHLGGRQCTVRATTMNITNVANGPAFQFNFVFPGVAPVISIFSIGIVPPNPGANPQLVELNWTADVNLPGQPYAAFATQWLDIENDPGFPVPQTPGIRTQIPLRYMVYPQ